MQAAYRRRLQSDTHVFHPLTNSEALEASVLKLRDDLTRLRRGVKQWAIGVATLLIVIVALVIWQLRGQAEMKAEMARLLQQGVMEYPRMEVQVRASQTEKDPTVVQERIYAELGKKYNVDPKILREKLPGFADELRRMPNASAYEQETLAMSPRTMRKLSVWPYKLRTRPRNSTPVNRKIPSRLLSWQAYQPKNELSMLVRWDISATPRS